MAADACALFVKAFAQFFQQQRVGLLVFRTDGGIGVRVAGIFPVDVNAVQVVAVNHSDGGIDKATPAFGGDRHVGKACGSIPTATD